MSTAARASGADPGAIHVGREGPMAIAPPALSAAAVVGAPNCARPIKLSYAAGTTTSIFADLQDNIKRLCNVLSVLSEFLNSSFTCPMASLSSWAETVATTAMRSTNKAMQTRADILGRKLVRQLDLAPTRKFIFL